MSDNNTSAITQKIWSMCGVLYDDRASYGDYLEQLTYLIFLKMADESVLHSIGDKDEKNPLPSFHL